MTDDRTPADRDAILDPEDVNSSPTVGSPAESDTEANDEVPVPIAMSPAEVDERAQAVEAMRQVPLSRPVEERSGDA
jgi:hypothetical protein